MNLQNQDQVRWPGSGSLVPGNTPFGFYDSDSQFNTDCYNGAKWAAIRLGYPVIDVELIDVNFYACYEEAVNEYGKEINSFNIKNNFLNLVGQDRSIPVNGKALGAADISYAVRLSQAYGSEIGVGGRVDIKKGHIDVVTNQQTYDLQQLWGNPQENCQRIEIKRIFHGPSPAFARIYDPFSMTGMSYSNVLNEMGFSGYSPATQFLMCPIFEDLLRGQAIEFNDMVRKSAYSFELANNKLKIFPIPTTSYKLYFEYVVENDKYNQTFYSGSSYQNISDYSNVPYENIQYSTINAPGRQWIRKYFLALCKELLGSIRQKYTSIPIPGGEVTMDGAELRSEASAEKEALITQLREMLDAMGNKAQLEASKDKSEYTKEILKSVPLMIYIA